jgi:hypothetical protein
VSSNNPPTVLVDDDLPLFFRDLSRKLLRRCALRDSRRPQALLRRRVVKRMHVYVGVDHLGIQVESDEEWAEMNEGLDAAALPKETQIGTA